MSFDRLLELKFKNELRKVGIRILPNMEGPVDQYERLIGISSDEPIGITALSFKCDLSLLFSDVVGWCKENEVRAVSFYAFGGFAPIEDYIAGSTVDVISPFNFEKSPTIITQSQIDARLNSFYVRFWFENNKAENWSLPNLNKLVEDGV